MDGQKSNSTDVPALQPWKAELELIFKCKTERTVLAERRHHGPLRVQKTLYPEDQKVCHAIIIHPPAGVAGGDSLTLRTRLDAQSHVLLTTPGASKWYKSNGAEASQSTAHHLDQEAVLEWLPQETILYDAAWADMETKIDLDAGAVYAGWEIVCFGRRACGEGFGQGRLHQKLTICREGQLLWSERVALDGGGRLMTSPAGLAGASVSATFVIAAGRVPAQLVDHCRKKISAEGLQVGVSALPGIFVARSLGNNALAARQYFEELWMELRPWYAGMPARRPRIWNT